MKRTEKIRIYLETSVIGDICDDTVRAEATREFFRIVTGNTDKYELVISPVVIAELNKSPQEKRKQFASFLESASFTELSKNQKVKTLTLFYLSAGVLSENHVNDLAHIAYAVVARCDYIISWDKHFVRESTMSRVRKANEQKKYRSPFIVTPEVFTGELNYAHD